MVDLGGLDGSKLPKIILDGIHQEENSSLVSRYVDSGITDLLSYEPSENCLRSNEPIYSITSDLCSGNNRILPYQI